METMKREDCTTHLSGVAITGITMAHGFLFFTTESTPRPTVGVQQVRSVPLVITPHVPAVSALQHIHQPIHLRESNIHGKDHYKPPYRLGIENRRARLSLL